MLTADDGVTYNRIAIYSSKESEVPLGDAASGEWSDWIYDRYTINGEAVDVAYKIRVLELDPSGESFTFYSSYVLDLKTGKYFYPQSIGEELYTNVGPMLQPSNYSRLNPQADGVLLESIEEMYRWHEGAINYLLDNKEWDLFYTHMHGIDMFMHFYLDHTLEAASPSMNATRKSSIKSMKSPTILSGRCLIGWTAKRRYSSYPIMAA